MDDESISGHFDSSQYFPIIIFVTASELQGLNLELLLCGWVMS
jgi:hypothetical protein